MCAHRKLDALCNGDTVLGNLWWSVWLLEHGVAPFRPEGYLQKQTCREVALWRQKISLPESTGFGGEEKLACNRSWGYTCTYFHFRMCTWTASASLSTPASIMPRPSVPKRRSLPAAAMRVACIERLGAARPAVCFTIERIICIAGMETYDEYFRTQSERAGSPP